jgi:ABC-2 type transport system permease protein
MNAYLKLVQAGLRAFVRDRAGLFWSFFFPLFFIFIFGSIFGKKGGDNITFDVRLVMEDASPEVAWVEKALSHPPLKIVKTDLATAKDALAKGKTRVIVQFPPDFSANLHTAKPTDVILYTDPNQQMSGVAAGIVREFISRMDKQMSHSPTMLQVVEGPAASPTGEKVEVGGINFLLPGILAMTIMQLGLFTAIPLINMREKGILKRLRATPLPRSTVVASQVTMRLVIGLIQTMVIVGVGVAFFQFRMHGSWLVLIPLVALGVLTFISIGAVLSSVAKTQESGMSMVQLVNFPMMFLSGLFFPIEILPSFFAPVVKVMPATYLAELLRNVMSGAPMAHSTATCLTVLFAWMAGALLIAARLFRWE